MRQFIWTSFGAVVALFFVAVAGCSRTQSPASTPAWDTSALQLPPGVSPQNLPDPDTPGARLEGQYCSACHGIPSPANHAAEDWNPTVRRMVLRMEHMAQMGGMGGMMGGGRMPMTSSAIAVPSHAEQEEILGYLRAHAMKSIDPRSLRSPSDPGAGLFAATCARCHALPDPAQHPAAQWPHVVERMRGNMQKMKVSAITDAQANEINTYLEQAAGAGGAP